MFLYQNLRRDDGGEEEDEDKAGDEDQVGGEKGELQVETVGTRSWCDSKGSTEACQDGGIKKEIVAVVVFVFPRCDTGDDGVGGQNQGGRNGCVEFEKRTNKCQADHSDQCVGKDEGHALQNLQEITLLVKSVGDLILSHPFGERENGDEDAAQLQGDVKWVFADAKDKHNVES